MAEFPDTNIEMLDAIHKETQRKKQLFAAVGCCGRRCPISGTCKDTLLRCRVVGLAIRMIGSNYNPIGVIDE